MLKLLSKHVFKEELNMAKKVSNKKPLFGNKRSHALNTTNSTQNLNLQVVRLVDGSRVRISAKEARTLRKAEKLSQENA